MHVLLVEDNPEDIVCVRRALRDLPGTIELSVVPNGRRALAFLHRWHPYAQVARPDLLFLDLHLPGKSGEEVLAALKQDPRLMHLPVVVLTSITAPREVTRCYELGANAFLVKPLQWREYRRLVRGAVEFCSACQSWGDTEDLWTG